jgi:hypothetical protein
MGKWRCSNLEKVKVMMRNRMLNTLVAIPRCIHYDCNYIMHFRIL